MSLRRLRGLVPLIVLLGIWQLLGSKSAITGTTPAPSVWWTGLKAIEHSGQLWIALRTTMLLYVEGMAGSIIIGVLLGTALGASRLLSRALNGMLEFMRATPAAVVVPPVLLLLHASKGAEIGIIVLGTVWPILLNTAAARRALPPPRLDVARSLRLSWPDRIRKFVLPSLLPEIMVGIRISASLCLIMTLLVDFLMATGGLGYLIVQFEASLESASAFGLLALIGVIGVLINVVIALTERVILRRWPSGAPDAV